MRLWFSRHKPKADPPRSASEQLRKARGLPPRVRKHPDLSDDPIRNWETSDQAFLRQSGDPSLDG
jgi:hypothetical protein